MMTSIVPETAAAVGQSGWRKAWAGLLHRSPATGGHGGGTVGSPGGLCALVLVLLLGAPACRAADIFASGGSFSVTYTFTTSTPATPVDVGAGRDLTVNNYLVTAVNDAGKGFLHNMAGHCTNIRFTNREQRTIDSRGYCNFRDGDGDTLFAEYATDGPVPASAIVNHWKLLSGTGRYDGIQGTMTDNNTGNLDGQGAYQAAGKMTGSFRIKREVVLSEHGDHD